MVAKSQLKLIKSLHQKKYRNLHGLFFVEGIKVVNELLESGMKPYVIFASTSTSVQFKTKVAITGIADGDLKKISALKNPNGVLGVFHNPKNKPIVYDDWILALDTVQDPGNLGTIIRACDWFGIHHLVCSQNTVDCFNPKVLQATMGSITRVNVHYGNLPHFLKNSPLPSYGAFMKGAPAYGLKLPKSGILVLGNEANGISKEVEETVSQQMAIPQFGEQTAESLNVGLAAGIFLNEIRKKEPTTQR